MNEKTPNNDTDWKFLFMKVLHCFGDTENDWHEEHWNKYGITKEQGKEIVKAYEIYEQERAK